MKTQLIPFLIHITPAQAQAIQSFRALGQIPVKDEWPASRIRAMKGMMTGVEFAKAVGVSPAVITRWCRGDYSPSPRHRIKLLEIEAVLNNR